MSTNRLAEPRLERHPIDQGEDRRIFGFRRDDSSGGCGELRERLDELRAPVAHDPAMHSCRGADDLDLCGVRRAQRQKYAGQS